MEVLLDVLYNVSGAFFKILIFFFFIQKIGLFWKTPIAALLIDLETSRWSQSTRN